MKTEEKKVDTQQLWTYTYYKVKDQLMSEGMLYGPASLQAVKEADKITTV